MSVQLIIIILYFIATVVIGVVAGKRAAKSGASFHGAAMGIFAIVCASTGEWLGGTATTGVSEYGFDFGLSGAWYTIANGIGVIFLALCFAKLYRSLNTVTVPGIIGSFLGVNARTVSSVFLTFVMIAVGISQMIAAGSLGVSLLGLDFNLVVVVFAVIFIVYTLAGGMAAVASTNVLHLIFMYGGVILAIILSLGLVGGWGGFMEGIAEVEAADAAAGTPSSYFNMFSIGMPQVSSWVIASLLGACTAQAGIQPVLAAKDVPTAKKACIITAFVVAPFGLFTALLGMVAKVMSHNGALTDLAGNVVTNGKLALPTLMMHLHPIAGGIVLASILAAILSTVSPPDPGFRHHADQGPLSGCAPSRRHRQAGAHHVPHHHRCLWYCLRRGRHLTQQLRYPCAGHRVLCLLHARGPVRGGAAGYLLQEDLSEGRHRRYVLHRHCGRYLGHLQWRDGPLSHPRRFRDLCRRGGGPRLHPDLQCRLPPRPQPEAA